MDLTLFDLRAMLLVSITIRVSQRRWTWVSEGHAKVRAEDVDDGLTLTLVVLSQSFKCVKPCMPKLHFLRAELLNRFQIELNDSTFCNIEPGVLGDSLLMRLHGGGNCLLMRENLILVVESSFPVIQIGLRGALAAPREIEREYATTCRADTQTDLRSVQARFYQVWSVQSSGG